MAHRRRLASSGGGTTLNAARRVQQEGDTALAIEGGAPVRQSLLPYGHQTIDEDDVEAVVAALRSEWLTTGPAVPAFEKALSEAVATEHAVTVSSGTAALHASMHALEVGPGDEVIVPAMTFAATASAVMFEGATPVFADVDESTLLIDPVSVTSLVGPRTRAIIAVDYAGQPCDYASLREIASARGIALVADACHSLGATYDGRPVGANADMTAFSFHPIKPITTGEGGAVTTSSAELAARVRSFRNHGMSSDFRQREHVGSWFYEIADLGYNYRLSEMQCALGISQLRKLRVWVERRQAIAARYAASLAQLDAVRPLAIESGRTHAFHLFVVEMEPGCWSVDRAAVFAALRAEGIGVNVHYIPAHLHPLYRRRLGTGPGLCPIAEAAYGRVLTLPVFPAMTDADVDDVVFALRKVARRYAGGA